MKALIVAATIAEIAPTLAHFNLTETSFIETDKFDVIVTGVGMVATAFCLGQALNNTKYNLVLNVGIAGSFNTAIALGNLVEVTEDVFAELGAEDHENFIALPDLKFGENTFKSTFELQLDLQKVKAITVNKVHGSAQSIKNIQLLFNPEIESMEGAAAFYACNNLNIPVVQVRAISNYVEPRNRENWQIGLAVKNLNTWLIKFLNKQK